MAKCMDDGPHIEPEDFIVDVRKIMQNSCLSSVDALYYVFF